MTNSISTGKTNGVPSSYLNSLDPREKQILIDANGVSINSLNGNDRKKEIKKLILILHVATGWPVPDNELMVILLDQLEKQITDKYGMLTPLEIEKCFRDFVPDESYGKAINLGLINAILQEYLRRRSEIVRSARQAAEKALKIDPMTDEQMINKARGEIQFYYNERKKGNNRPIMFSYWKEILIHDKFMREDQEMADFFDFCLEKKVKNIYLYEPPIGKYEYKHYDNQDLPF